MNLGRLRKSELTGEHLELELARIVATVLGRANPRVIILFGSACHDALTAASDIDLALVFGTQTEAEEARRNVLHKGPLSAWPIDFVFTGTQEFKEKKALGGVFSHIAQGRVLHPSGFDWSEL